MRASSWSTSRSTAISVISRDRQRKCFAVPIFRTETLSLTISSATLWLKSTQTDSNRLKPSQIDSNRVKSSQIDSNRLKSSQIESNRLKSSQIESNRLKSSQIESNESWRKNVLTCIPGQNRLLACLLGFGSNFWVFYTILKEKRFFGFKHFFYKKNV